MLRPQNANGLRNENNSLRKETICFTNFHVKNLFTTFFPAFIYNERKTLKQRKAKPYQKFKK
jgi:hypothetical protein